MGASRCQHVDVTYLLSQNLKFLTNLERLNLADTEVQVRLNADDSMRLHASARPRIACVYSEFRLYCRVVFSASTNPAVKVCTASASGAHACKVTISSRMTRRYHDTRYSCWHVWCVNFQVNIEGTSHLRWMTQKKVTVSCQDMQYSGQVYWLTESIVLFVWNMQRSCRICQWSTYHTW